MAATTRTTSTLVAARTATLRYFEKNFKYHTFYSTFIALAINQHRNVGGRHTIQPSRNTEHKLQMLFCTISTYYVRRLRGEIAFTHSRNLSCSNFQAAQSRKPQRRRQPLPTFGKSRGTRDGIGINIYGRQKPSEGTATAQVHSKICACAHLCTTPQGPAPRVTRHPTQHIPNNVNAQLIAAGATAALSDGCRHFDSTKKNEGACAETLLRELPPAA